MLLESSMMTAEPGSAYDLMELSVFKSPMSVAGTGTLAMYCLDQTKEGMRFVYTPDLRSAVWPSAWPGRMWFWAWTRPRMISGPARARCHEHERIPLH